MHYFLHRPVHSQIFCYAKMFCCKYACLYYTRQICTGAYKITTPHSRICSLKARFPIILQVYELWLPVKHPFCILVSWRICYANLFINQIFSLFCFLYTFRPKQCLYVEIKCQLDATDDFYCMSYCLLNMFRAPLCPSSGAREYYGLLLLLQPQTGHTTLSSTPYRQLENQSTKYDRQQPLV